MIFQIYLSVKFRVEKKKRKGDVGGGDIREHMFFVFAWQYMGNEKQR